MRALNAHVARERGTTKGVIFSGHTRSLTQGGTSNFFDPPMDIEALSLACAAALPIFLEAGCLRMAREATPVE